jgi:XRE family transcriptional regulator, fatty acid utilization regulator
MSFKDQSKKIVFGLKMKHLRLAKKLSFAELGEITGMSVSYLNEIEKGKKFPKPDKLKVIATALGIDLHKLVSEELPNHLEPIKELLESNFLNELPLEFYGTDLAKVTELIANSPLQIGAFIATMIEIAGTHASHQNNFYFSALKHYLEFNKNYFEELEAKAAEFSKKHNISVTKGIEEATLVAILKNEYAYTIVENGLENYPELKDIRAVYVPKKKKLLLNKQLTDLQRLFQFSKELGFNYLALKQRANTSSLLKVNNFVEVLNHFKAGYFAAAILLPMQDFAKDITQMMQQKEWDDKYLLQLMHKYNASPDMLFQRFTNLLSSRFGMQKQFFLRCYHNHPTDTFEINKEMQLNQALKFRRYLENENYCQRWLGVSMLKEFRTNQLWNPDLPFSIGIQKSHFIATSESFLCFNITQKGNENRNVSVTLGIHIDELALSSISFLNDPRILHKNVGITCERCKIQDCKERLVPPIYIQRKISKQKIFDAIKKLTD